MVENKGLISNHQFGLRQRHSTIEETCRIVRRIDEALENKQYCSAVFLSVRQSLEYWTIQVTTVSPSELFHYTKLLFA
jgi:hypothetical protein